MIFLPGCEIFLPWYDILYLSVTFLPGYKFSNWVRNFTLDVCLGMKFCTWVLARNRPWLVCWIHSRVKKANCELETKAWMKAVGHFDLITQRQRGKKVSLSIARFFCCFAAFFPTHKFQFWLLSRKTRKSVFRVFFLLCRETKKKAEIYLFVCWAQFREGGRSAVLVQHLPCPSVDWLVRKVVHCFKWGH
jgi:hypothetical protein